MVKLTMGNTNQESTNQPNPEWLNKSNMALSLGISVQAFDKWNVDPVAKIGREVFFDVRSVVANRLEHAEKTPRGLTNRVKVS